MEPPPPPSVARSTIAKSGRMASKSGYKDTVTPLKIVPVHNEIYIHVTYRRNIIQIYLMRRKHV